MNPKLPAMLAAELDGIDSDTARARRAAELCRAMAESFPERYATAGFRAHLLNAALDLDADADVRVERMAEDEAADDYMSRAERYVRQHGVPAFLAEQCE